MGFQYDLTTRIGFYALLSIKPIDKYLTIVGWSMICLGIKLIKSDRYFGECLSTKQFKWTAQGIWILIGCSQGYDQQ